MSTSPSGHRDTLPELIAEVRRRQDNAPIRMPVGIIGPREATAVQYASAQTIGRGIAEMGFAVICGGRSGVMEAACKGATEAGGIAIGVLPDSDPSVANSYATVVIASGIGEARNAVIARAALCLVAIGDNFGTLTEVAFGRQFGKVVIGLEGAAKVDGVIHVDSPVEALVQVARLVLAEGH